MAQSINVSYLLGFVGKEPETKVVASGKKVMLFNLATEQSWKKGDEWQKQTTWHRIIVWEPSDYVLKEVVKGAQVLITGRISTRTYKDSNNQDRSITEIIAEKVVPLNPPREHAQSAPKPPPPADSSQGDDIPF